MMTSPQGEERIITILGPGSMVGELSMIDGLPRSATVTALEDGAFRFVNREAFDQCVKTHPEICRSLMVTLASRLREADQARPQKEGR